MTVIDKKMLLLFERYLPRDLPVLGFSQRLSRRVLLQMAQQNPCSEGLMRLIARINAVLLG